jgi:hypothetical protein
MCLELMIDVGTGLMADRRRGRILVRGHFRNLGRRPHLVSAGHVRYSLAGPGGEPSGVRDDAPRSGAETVVPPSGVTAFEAELTAHGPPELRAGPEYRLSAALPDGSDRASWSFTFRQSYLGPQ